MIIEEFDASSGSRKSSPDGLAPPGFDPGERAWTPGPWIVDYNGPYAFLGAANGSAIFGAAAINAADAHLAAAAPDLFEALLYVKQAIGDPVPIGKRHIVRRIDAALTKASQAQGQPE